MNRQWKLVIVLICALVIVSTFGVLTWAKNNDLTQQLKDQESLELQLGTQEIEIQNLKNPEPVETIQPADTENIDQEELLEFLSSYVSAQKAYIKTLKQIMDNNRVTYPQFIYAELEEQ